MRRNLEDDCASKHRYLRIILVPGHDGTRLRVNERSNLKIRSVREREAYRWTGFKMNSEVPARSSTSEIARCYNTRAVK